MRKEGSEVGVMSREDGEVTQMETKFEVRKRARMWMCVSACVRV